MLTFPVAHWGAEVAPFDPHGEGALAWWLEADKLTGLADNDPVSSFDNAGDLTATFTAASTARPTYKTAILNGKPVIRLDGTDDALSLVDLIVSSGSYYAPDFTVIACFALTGTALAVHEALFSFFTDSEHRAILIATDPNAGSSGVIGYYDRQPDVSYYGDLALTRGQFYVVTYRIVQNSTASYWVNGVAQGSVATASILSIDSSGITDWYMGARFHPSNGVQNFFRGDIAAILGYDGGMADTNRQNVENHLMSKYGIS